MESFRILLLDTLFQSLLIALSILPILFRKPKIFFIALLIGIALDLDHVLYPLFNLPLPTNTNDLVNFIMAGQRTALHSLAFAALTGFVFLTIHYFQYKEFKLVMWYTPTIALSTHILFDATTGNQYWSLFLRYPSPNLSLDSFWFMFALLCILSFLFAIGMPSTKTS